ncbi:glycosyltransferase sugar-binding region DXD domain-containing protein-containing protein [Stachybotrys elegans]|uniref:Glycosyltransferase sugar-binding region DXD domain-containing protein-containing protein n=1 Tax=Stachybotrys elegans TaxID=80388 RepID=A0A8K0WQD0_9HYPO|nr:glycosyltransferase sugar-binding region DXD domain-containing protein-containing protein [Stachybotrys elegans]
MINSRRALIVAALVLTVFFLISIAHSSSDTPAELLESQKHHAQSPEGSVGYTPSHPHAQRQTVQKPMVDMSHMSVYDKLAYAYPYDVDTKFPAFIWQTWKRSAADKDFEFREQEASWTQNHPTFVHEVITDELAPNLLRLLYATVPEVLETYHALPLPVLKADFFRYLVLYARGGIYSDIDTVSLKSALEWLPKSIPRETVGLVIGVEADPDRPDWADWYSRRIQFCQWTIQSKPGHPVLRDIITRIANQTLTYKREGRLSRLVSNDVVDFTGPAIWTDTIMDYFNDERYFNVAKGKGSIDWRNFTGMTTSKRVGDVAVLPITSFSPGVGQMGAGEVDDPMAFVQHGFEGTWKPESERHIGET